MEKQLRRAIARYVNARLDDSWKHGGDPADVPRIEANLRAAKSALETALRKVFPVAPDARPGPSESRTKES